MVPPFIHEAGSAFHASPTLASPSANAQLIDSRSLIAPTLADGISYTRNRCGIPVNTCTLVGTLATVSYTPRPDICEHYTNPICFNLVA